MAGQCNLPSVSSSSTERGGLAKSSSAFLRSQIDFVRVACCEGCWDGVRRPCSIPEKDSLKCAFLSLVLFGANCLIRTKSHRWRLVAGRKVIVVSENAHAPQKKNRTLPPKWGRLITNSEFVSCLVAQRITGMLAGMSGLLPPSFKQHSLADLQPTLIKMIQRFAKLRHKWVVRRQMQRPYI